MPELEEPEKADADEDEFEVEPVLAVVVELPFPAVEEAVLVLVFELSFEAPADEVFFALPPFALEEFELAPVEAFEPEFESVPVCESAWLPCASPCEEPEVEPEALPEVLPEPEAEPEAEEPLPDVLDVEEVSVCDDESEDVVEVELLPVVIWEPCEPFEVFELESDEEFALVEFEEELDDELDDELDVAACA